MFEEIIKYFNWSAFVIASLGTALVMVVVNQTSPGQRIHNAYIALGAAGFFSALLTDWSGFFNHPQAILLQLSFTFLVAAIIGFTRYQDVVDTFVGNMLEKANIKKGSSDAGTPPAPKNTDQ